jgi:DNA invertase Pin-like site-specific DNA recombinase
VSTRGLTVEGYVRRPQIGPRMNEDNASVFESAAARRGWRLARTLYEEGGTHRLDEVLRRIESGEIDGLIVSQLPDLGQSLGEAVAAIDRIRAAGGTVFSANDQIELGPLTGLHIWRLLVSLAEW